MILRPSVFSLDLRRATKLPRTLCRLSARRRCSLRVPSTRRQRGLGERPRNSKGCKWRVLGRADDPLSDHFRHGAFAGNNKSPFAGTLGPSSGLEPETPSLPCAPIGNRSQPAATVFAYLSRSRGCPICHELPPVATARAQARVSASYPGRCCPFAKHANGRLPRDSGLRSIPQPEQRSMAPDNYAVE